jgi:hypothetical protein
MKPEQWIINGEVGTSSKTIWAVMMGAVMEKRRDSWDYGCPHDPDDFSRCWKLLSLFPEWRERLPEVSKIFPEWTGFIREWDKLTEMLESNLKNEPNGYGYSREMYDFMQKLLDEGLLADGWEQTGIGSWKRGTGSIVTITPETAKIMTANINKILKKSKSK